MRFFIRIFISPYPHKVDCYILTKNFVQKFVYERRERYFKIKLYSFAKGVFRTTFVQYVTAWLVRIWTYKNADEKGHKLVHGEAKT